MYICIFSFLFFFLLSFFLLQEILAEVGNE